MKERAKLLWKLFSAFFRIGLFTFGGGYAMIPLIEADVVENKKWIKHEELLDILAIAESTPGPLAVNSATFVGYKLAGVPGAAMATLGVVLPSFIIISIISLFLMQFKENRWVAWAFEGIRAGVVALMINAVIKLGRHMPKNAFTLALLAGAFALAAFTSIDVIFVLLAAAVLGILFQLFLAKGGEAK